jgi:hypothetical protein
VHLRLHIVTPAVYASPAATVSTRLLLRVLEDLLLPQAYPAELAGSSYSLDSEQGGLLLKVVGFPGVVTQLLGLVLQGIMGERRAAVQSLNVSLALTVDTVYARAMVCACSISPRCVLTHVLQSGVGVLPLCVMASDKNPAKIRYPQH